MSTVNTTVPNSVDEVLPQARRLEPTAVQIVLRAYYPTVCRIACALCGLQKPADEVVTIVMKQCLHALPYWSNEAEAGNWFMHHTILNCREQAPELPEGTEDCLVARAKDPSPQYIAFVRAWRHLPPQQREAFLLFRGEKLELRQIGVAMDCSTGAATTHYIASNKEMTAITGESFETDVAELAKVYGTLSPPEQYAVGDVGAVARELGRKKMWRFVGTLLAWAVLGGIAFGIWRLWRMIEI